MEEYREVAEDGPKEVPVLIERSRWLIVALATLALFWWRSIWVTSKPSSAIWRFKN